MTEQTIIVDSILIAAFDAHVLLDARVSMKAKGLAAILLSVGTWARDEHITTEELIELSTDGRDAVLSGLRELEAAGYLRRTRRTGEGGRIHWVRTMRSRPAGEDGPSPDGPLPDRPSPEKPPMADRASADVYTKTGDVDQPSAGFPSTEKPPMVGTRPQAPTMTGKAAYGEGSTITGQAVYGQGVTITGKAVHGEGVPTSGGKGLTMTGKAAYGEGSTMTGKAVYGQGVTMTGKAVHGEGVPTSGEGSTITGKAVHGQGVTITGKAVHGEGVQDPKAGVSLDTVSSDASDPTTTGEAGHGHAGAPVRPHVHTHAGAYTRAYADTRACTHADARTDQDINIYNSSSYLNNENNEEEEYLDLDHSSSSLLNGSLGDQVHPGSRARVQAGAPAGSGSLDSVSSDRSADSHRAGSGSLDSVSSDGPADSHRTGSSSLNSVSSDGTADSHRTGSRSLDSVSSDGTADSRRTDSGSLDSVSSDKLADSHRTGSDSLDSVSSDGANPALAELACRILTACGVRVSAQRLYPHYPFEKIRAEAVRFMEQYATGYQREKNAGILVHRIKQAIYVPLSETEKLSSTYLQWRTEAERRDDQAALVGRTHDVAGRRERVQVETIPGTRALVVHDPATPPAAPEWAGVLRELALSGSERLFRGTAAAPTADGSWLVYTPDARDVEYLQTRAVRQVRWKLAPAIGKPPHEVAVHFTADRTEYMARAIGEFHEITRACPSVY